MAGRRRTGAALAAGVGALSAGLQTRIGVDVERQRSREKFRERLTEALLTGKVPGYEPRPEVAEAAFGGLARRAAAPLTLKTLLKSATDGGFADSSGYKVNVAFDAQGRLKGYHVRSAPTVSPTAEPLRQARLLSTIQDIEQQNRLAPMLAASKQRELFPQALPFQRGGFVEGPPGLLDQFMGRQQRPSAPALSAVDTSALRSALPFDVAAPASAAEDDDVNALMEAIQDGRIQTRQQAEQALLASGLNPSDPTWQQLLSRLP